MSIFSRIRVISISRCDGVVSLKAVVKVFSSLEVIPVPDKSDAWFKDGSVRILAVTSFRICDLSSFRVVNAFISGGWRSAWSGSSFLSCGPVAAVHMHVWKFEMVVSSASSGLVVRCFIMGWSFVDVVMFPCCLSLSADIAMRVSWSNGCCSML